MDLQKDLSGCLLVCFHSPLRTLTLEYPLEDEPFSMVRADAAGKKGLKDELWSLLGLWSIYCVLPTAVSAQDYKTWGQDLRRVLLEVGASPNVPRVSTPWSPWTEQKREAVFHKAFTT